MAAFTAVLFFARRGYVRAGLTGAAATLVMEAIQPLFGRTASIVDALIGLGGVAVTLGGIYVWREGQRRHRLLHAVLTLLVVAGVLAPVRLEWTASRWRSSSFPLLGAFEDEIELRLWQYNGPVDDALPALQLSSEHVSQGHRSLAVRTGDGSWPGVFYLAGGADWTAHERLRWDLYNPGEPFRLRVRIDDGPHVASDAAFHERISIWNGWNHCDLPTERMRHGADTGEVDLARVWRLLLYVDDGEQRAFFLDNVRLTGGRGATSGGTSGATRVSSNTVENPGKQG
jgi:hypothetical protein